MADEELSPLDETNGGRGSGGGGKARGRGFPVGPILPHSLLGRQKSLANGLQNQFVVVGPEVSLSGDGVHEVFLGKKRGLSAPVAVEDSEERKFQVSLIFSLLIGDTKHVLHILSASLVAVPGHSEVHSYGRRHGGRGSKSLETRSPGISWS